MTRSDPQATFDASITMLTEDACLGRLAQRDVGRIAFMSRGRIEIFPVNYAMEGAIIVLRTAPGTKLDAIPRSSVAFEVDDWDSLTGDGWSVVARGLADEVTRDPGRVAEHLRSVPVRPVAPGDRWHWIAIKPSEITGRQFHVPPTVHTRV